MWYSFLSKAPQYTRAAHSDWDIERASEQTNERKKKSCLFFVKCDSNYHTGCHAAVVCFHTRTMFKMTFEFRFVCCNLSLDLKSIFSWQFIDISYRSNLITGEIVSYYYYYWIQELWEFGMETSRDLIENWRSNQNPVIKDSLWHTHTEKG